MIEGWCDVVCFRCGLWVGCVGVGVVVVCVDVVVVAMDAM